MTAFQGAVDATLAAFGVDAVYTPAGGEPVWARVSSIALEALVSVAAAPSVPTTSPSALIVTMLGA